MKIITSLVIMTTILAKLNADLYDVKPIFDSNAMCANLGKNFAIGYEFSKKDKSSYDFCRGIVASNIRATNIPCNTEEIVNQCSKYIDSQRKEQHE